MKKQIILLSLFLVFGLFSSPIQAANLGDLETCPNSKLRSQASDSSSRRINPLPKNLDDLEICPNRKLRSRVSASSSRRINPFLPKGENVVEALPENEALKEGDSCKVATVETRPGLNGGYEGGGYVQWTLVKKEGNKEVWAVHTEWELIYVGGVEDGTYTFFDAKWLCRDKEIVIDGEKIQMTLPEVFYGGRVGSNIERLTLDFELLKHINYESVVPHIYATRLWSNDPPLLKLGVCLPNLGVSY